MPLPFNSGLIFSPFLIVPRFSLPTFFCHLTPFLLAFCLRFSPSAVSLVTFLTPFPISVIAFVLKIEKPLAV